jgi:hypothetical protein
MIREQEVSEILSLSDPTEVYDQSVSVGKTKRSVAVLATRRFHQSPKYKVYAFR